MRSLVYDENLCKIDGHKFAFFFFGLITENSYDHQVGLTRNSK